MRPTDRTGLAIILSLVALTLFDAMGLIIKHLANDYSAAQLSAWRNMFGLIPAVIALCSSQAWRINGKRLNLRQWKLALFRGAVVTFAQLCFYLSLGLMDFATASTITYASALFATAMAIPILGERVGWLRWIAVLIGFVGVIMVIKPGGDTRRGFIDGLMDHCSECHKETYYSDQVINCIRSQAKMTFVYPPFYSALRKEIKTNKKVLF